MSAAGLKKLVLEDYHQDLDLLGKLILQRDHPPCAYLHLCSMCGVSGRVETYRATAYSAR